MKNERENKYIQNFCEGLEVALKKVDMPVKLLYSWEKERVEGFVAGVSLSISVACSSVFVSAKDIIRGVLKALDEVQL